jgi:formate dehydrogenase iron-sulfur subunit
MYVLHHADKPSLYAGLPDNPRISFMVELWKGALKPLAVAGLAFAALAGFAHSLMVGPDEVQPEDEARGRRLFGRTDPEPQPEPKDSES